MKMDLVNDSIYSKMLSHKTKENDPTETVPLKSENEKSSESC